MHENEPMKFAHINELCDLVRETSFAIHRFHRHGHVEKIYEKPWSIACASRASAPCSSSR